MSLSTEQVERVKADTYRWIQKASALYERSFDMIEVRFDLRGRTSGMFCVSGREKYIRYNSAIFAEYYTENLEQTVPHEVAHYAVYEVFGRKTKPHGIEWKTLMNAFGVSAEVTSKLDVTHLATRKLRRYTYECGCGERELTSIRHNRIVRGQREYGCPRCKQPLRYIC